MYTIVLRVWPQVYSVFICELERKKRSFMQFVGRPTVILWNVDNVCKECEIFLSNTPACCWNRCPHFFHMSTSLQLETVSILLIATALHYRIFTFPVALMLFRFCSLDFL